MRKALLILWPSFIVGVVAAVLFFTALDPLTLHPFGHPTDLSRLAVYSIGFLFFWALGAASSAFTCFLQRSPAEINR